MADDLSIPDFLLVANRKPPTPEQEEAARVRITGQAHARPLTDAPEWFKGNRWSLPKTMTPEAWEIVRQRQERERNEARYRIDSLRLSKGLEPHYHKDL